MSDVPKWLTVAQLVRTHGVHGGLVARLETDFPEHLRQLHSVRLWPLDKMYAVSRVSSSGQSAHFVLHSVANLEDAKALVGQEVQVPWEERWPLAADRFYDAELIGLQVEDLRGAILGRVAEIMHLPANDVLIVRRPKAADLLLPALRSVIRAVDTDGGRLVIPPLEELFDATD